MLPIHRLQLANFLVQQEINNAQDDLRLNHFTVAARIMRTRRRQRNKVVWVRNWLQMWPLYEQYEKLMVKLQNEHVAGFRNFMRMDPAMFQELIQRLGDWITKQATWFQKALEPGLKMVITLRHLAAGDIYNSLMYSFRVASNTISLIIREVCFKYNFPDCPRGVRHHNWRVCCRSIGLPDLTPRAAESCWSVCWTLVNVPCHRCYTVNITSVHKLMWGNTN